MKTKSKEQFKNDKEKQGPSSKYRCYGCKEKGHVNAYCPNIKKGEENKFFKKKKMYIAYEDNDSSFSSLSDYDEQANICIMANSESFGSQVSVSSWNNDYENLHDAFQ